MIAKATTDSTTDWFVTPEITTNANAQDEADRKNTARLSAIGVKEAIRAEITVIVGDHITNPIPRTTYRAGSRTVDQYALHQLLSTATNGSERPLAIVIRQMMVDVMVT